MKTASKKCILFCAVLVLGAFLRFTAISWGIPTAQFPHEPYHPDETWALHILGHSDVLHGRFNPWGAHLEGTFCYFVWLAVGYAAYLFGYLHGLPPFHLAGPDLAVDPATFLILARSTVAVFDLGTGCLVFYAVYLVTAHFWSSLLAMLVFVITPFELIHAHFMRTHIMANLPTVASIVFAFRLVTRYSNWSCLWAGIFSGLSFASRYPNGVVGIVPLLVCLTHEWTCIMRGLKSNVGQVTRLLWPAKILYGIFSSAQLWALLCGLLAGAFIGVPFLFLDFDFSVKQLEPLGAFTQKTEFEWQKLFDLSRLWIFLSHLIPYGSLPGLWILFYAAVLLLLFCPKLYRYTLPLFVFSFCFLFAMGKGYWKPNFIRAAAPLFPVFAICVGLAALPLINFIRRATLLRLPLFGAIVLIVASTIAYDIAYLKAMRNDPRDQLFTYLQENFKDRTLRIGTHIQEWGFFLAQPILQAVSNPTINASQGRNDTFPDVDYYLVFAYEVKDYPIYHNLIESLETKHGFRPLKTFEAPLTFAGYRFDFKNNPHDLNYALPSYTLLERGPR